MPKSRLPINHQMEEVTDPQERWFIDALQPSEVRTPRRACLEAIKNPVKALLGELP
jgi:hypothetical protein